MSFEIKVMSFGSANSYLLKSDHSFVLVDTGFLMARKRVVAELDKVGCKPGDLKLILLTHGDYDHVGNAAFLREKYGAPIAMHRDDLTIVKTGKIMANRKVRPDSTTLFMRLMIYLSQKVAKQGAFQTFEPDIFIDEDFDLSTYGLDAKIIHIPGHSKGSIGLLTNLGEFFCGDFLYNMPGFKFIDNLEDHDQSMKKLQSLKPKVVYPGHGKSFTERAFL
jgi:hydroxyacylglutathione hydrolase